MIEINIEAMVENGEEEIGVIERVILDHNSFEATHLVIRRGGSLHPRHILMPIDWIVSSTHDRLRIERSGGELEGLPNFETQHYVSLDHLDEEQWQHPRSRIRPTDWINYLVPLVANAFGDPYHTMGVVVTNQLMEATENAIGRGLPVESSDEEQVGEVAEVLLSKPDWRLSALVVACGAGRGGTDRTLRVPADWIAIIQSDRIVLNRTSEQFESWMEEQEESQ
jgi:uncharacterized protein YrrD